MKRGHNNSSNRMRNKRNIRDGLRTELWYKDRSDWKMLQTIHPDSILISIKLKILDFINL